jgi:protein gp37
VWNAVTGCQKVSAGCKHCYAETVAARFWATQYPQIAVGPTLPDSGPTAWRDRRFTDVQCHTARLAAPLSWRKPATVFVNSMSDLFHEDVPDAFIDQVFAVMALCPQHAFIVLTKRPERMRVFLSDAGLKARLAPLLAVLRPEGSTFQGGWLDRWLRYEPNWPLKHVWLGVSVEDQATADARIPLLLHTPAALRFVSAEPLLGPVNLREMAHREDWHVDALNTPDPSCRVDWLIIGGESGPSARPCDVAWIRSLKDQAAAAGVPCFVKQLGAYPRVEPGRLRHWEWGGEIGQADREGRFTADGAHWRLHLKNRKGGDPAEWPVDLRVREWPDARAGEAREVGRVR